MGQYHYIVNLDKREFIHPYGLDIGLKAWEQIANPASTPHALFALLMCSNERGGGDLKRPRGLNEPVLGRWAGDRIAVVGDYADDDDIRRPLPDPLSAIYELCREGVYRDVTHLVRPVLAAELGVAYREEDGLWRVARDPAAAWSVLDG